MKYKYKDMEGIAALKAKRNDEKKNATNKKSWSERRGIISKLSQERKDNGNRKNRRMSAKRFIKNPLGLGHT